MESFWGIESQHLKTMMSYETIFPNDCKRGTTTRCHMKAFYDCKNAFELPELLLLGKKFTWSKGNWASCIDMTFFFIY